MKVNAVENLSFPTHERGNKGEMRKEEVEIDGKKQRVYRMMDILDLLFTRKQITDDQYRVGMIFYRDWYHSGLSGIGAIDYSKIKVDVSGIKVATVKSLDALTRWQKAVKAIGRVHCHPLVHMILLEQSPEEYGMSRGQRSPKLARLVAITLLQSGLDALHDYYG